MLDLIDSSFVVQWVNIRQEGIPDFPAREDILLGAVIDDHGRIQDPASLGYFLRLLVLDPTDEALLNPQATTSAESVQTMVDEGHFAYAQVHADAVLEVLEQGLQAWLERHPPTP